MSAMRLAALGFVAVLIQIAVRLAAAHPRRRTPTSRRSSSPRAGFLTGALPGAVFGFGVGIFVDLAFAQTLGVSALIFLPRRLRRRPRARAARARGAGHAARARRRRDGVRRLSATRSSSSCSASTTPISLLLVRDIVVTVVLNSLIAVPVHSRRPPLARAGAARGPAPPAPPSRLHDRRAEPALAPVIEPPARSAALPLPPQLTRRAGVLGVLAFVLFGDHRLPALVSAGADRPAERRAGDRERRALDPDRPRRAARSSTRNGNVLASVTRSPPRSRSSPTTCRATDATPAEAASTPGGSRSTTASHACSGSRRATSPGSSTDSRPRATSPPRSQNDVGTYALVLPAASIADAFPGVVVQQVNLRNYPQGDIGAVALGEIGPISKGELGTSPLQGDPAGHLRRPGRPRGDLPALPPGQGRRREGPGRRVRACPTGKAPQITAAHRRRRRCRPRSTSGSSGRATSRCAARSRPHAPASTHLRPRRARSSRWTPTRAGCSRSARCRPTTPTTSSRRRAPRSGRSSTTQRRRRSSTAQSTRFTRRARPSSRSRRSPR